MEVGKGIGSPKMEIEKREKEKEGGESVTLK